MCASLTALAHLGAEGAVLPFGEKRVQQRADTTLPYQLGGVGSGYRVGDQFNFSLADVYVLPLWGRAVEVEPPSVFMSNLPNSMSAKVRRPLYEAMASYRAGTLVGTVILLATALEAAWEQVAIALGNRGEASISRALADPMTSAARLQALVAKAIAQRKLSDAATLANLDAGARNLRDLRNHVAHEPKHAFNEQLFSRPTVAAPISGAAFYFRRLYDVHDRLT